MAVNGGELEWRFVMVQRVLIAFTTAALLVMLAVGTALAGNPAGTGQPGAECGAAGATMEPPGFGTGGFANAESRYAGSEGTPSAANANSSHAVSQYDVACYQITQHH
jgi:hypothetical protein